MRRLPSGAVLLCLPTLVGLLGSLAVALPVVTLPAAATAPGATGAAVPVRPSVSRLALRPPSLPGGVSALTTGRALELPAQRTAPFATVGVTWAADPAVGAVQVQVRTRTGGSWTGWTAFETGSHDAADPGTADARGRSGTEPSWVGPSDGVQARLTAPSGARPRDVRVELVDAGTSRADAAAVAPAAPRSAAFAAEARPAILRRAAWGADESIRGGSPSYSHTVKVAFVHHTASTSSYSAAQALEMVRGIYAYHVKSRGWSDVGYNFLVDKFGRVYEGRAGGVGRFVVGAHTGGFNRDTVGVAFLGDYSTAAPPAVALRAAERVMAWKLGTAYRDPSQRVALRSAGGGTSRFRAGATPRFATVSAHREAGYTDCPGAPTFARMGAIRTAVKAYLGAGFVAPVVTGPRSVPRGATGSVTVTARTLSRMSWAFTVITPQGRVLRKTRGTSTRAAGIWNLRDRAGRAVAPGTYTLRLSGAAGNDPARAWTTRVTVGAPPV